MYCSTCLYPLYIGSGGKKGEKVVSGVVGNLLDFVLHSSGRLVDFGYGVGGLNEHSGAIRLNPFRCAYHLDGFFHGVSECGLSSESTASVVGITAG